VKDWKYDLEEWRERYALLTAIAKRVQESRNNRARRLCAEAGLDSSLLGIHPHNAMVSFRYGKPWKGINYSKVRACMRELNREFEASAIVTRWDRRVRNIG